MSIASPPRVFVAALVFGSACAGGDDGSGDTATGSSGTAAGPGTSTASDDGADDDAPATNGSGPATTATGTSTTSPGTDTMPGTDDTTTAGPGEAGHYLLTVDDAASPPVLVRIDLDVVAAEVACELPNNSAYDSIVFSRDGELFGNNQAQGRLETINPCNCGFQLVGPTSAGALVLTIGEGDGLYAIDTGLDALAQVDPATGLANVIGGLAIDFAGAGAAWSDALTGIYAVEDATDQLYAIDHRTGVAATTVGLDLDVTTPGLAVHPDGTFWLCSGSTLHELDPLTGTTTEAGTLELAGPCRNLTAPQTAISCLD